MVKLSKKIISNKLANEAHSKDFSKLAKSTSFVDDTRITEIYNDLFYTIPVGGKNSHKNIVEQSDNYINYQHNLVLDNDIKKLTNKLSSKETELTTLENPIVAEHPVYEDGAILVVGENGQQYQDMTTKYIMQEGRRRAFNDDNIFINTKKALQLPLDDLDGRYYVTLDELNSLPDGPVISTTSDLFLKGNDLITDIPDIIGTSAYVDIELECLGNEVSDYVGAATNNMLDLDINTLQFYLNNDACVVKYIKDDYINDDTGPTLIETSIPKGETKIIRILRETEIGNNMIPTDISQNPIYGYNNNLPTNITYNGNELFNYAKLWGPNREYPSVVYASGRIRSKEIENAHIGDVLSQFGETQPITYRLFNGLPTSETAEGAFGSADIQLITDPNYTGQEKSNWGTKMIYRTPGFYGALNHSADLQSKVFDNPGSKYYSHECYGQPIIRYLSRYLVINKTYKDWGKRVAFWDAADGSSHDKSRGSVEDALGLYMDLSGNDILGLRWDTLKKDRIKYIGLQEYKTREQPVDDNIFNSIDGSNYEINQYNSL